MKKTAVNFLLILIIFFGLIQPNTAHAVIPVFDSIATAATNVWNAKGEIAENLLVALNEAANRTFSTLLSQWINKVAQESAIYLVAGSKGEKPAFMTMKKGEFWKQLGDEALGTFTENFFSALQENHEEIYTDTDSFTCRTTSDTSFENVRVNVFGDFHLTTDPVTLVETKELENLHLKYTVYEKVTSTNEQGEEITKTQEKNGYPKSIYTTKGKCPDKVSYYALPNDDVNKVCLTEMEKDGNINNSCITEAVNSLAKVATGQGSRDTITSGSADYLNAYLSGEKKILGLDVGSGQLNICQPSSLAVSLKLGLGLPQPGNAGNGPNSLPCSWQEMKKDWTKFRQETIGDPSKLIAVVQDMFEPGSNDLSIAFDIHSSQSTFVEYQKTSKSEDLNESFGLNVKTDPGDRMLELPFAVKWNLEKSMDNIKSPWLSNTADAFLNAVNLFISTASNAAYEKYMAKLMKHMNKTFGDSPTGSTDNPLYSYYSSSPGLSRAQSEEIMAPLTEMNFGEGKDINLLSYLAACPDINNPGPMNCVVNDNFMQAVIQGMTVSEAINKKLINENASFGIEMNNPRFNLGSGDISWRAMKILRKYRILPVGWELAAERLNHKQETAKIKDMVDCFYDEDRWCRGLVDPNWLLKAPLTYCAKSGFGGQLEDIRIVGEDTLENIAMGTEEALGQISVLRAGDYCADEQSCIKEGSNSCELYGYCIEDRRTWQFPGKTCQPQFNTCQTYTSQQGQSTAYLSNTLDYGNSCDAENTGCLAYCSDYNWSTNSYNCNLESPDNKYYLSGKVEACSENNDGCTQLIRTSANSGGNLLFNGDFESSLVGTTLLGPPGPGDTLLNDEHYSGESKTLNNRLDNWYFNTSNIEAEIIDNSDGLAFSGKSLKITTLGHDNGLISTDWSAGQQSSLPKNFLMRPGVSYTLSAYIYTADVPVTIAIGNSNSGLWVKQTAQPDNSWQRLSVTINNDNYYRANAFTIYTTQPGTFYLDDIMFEMNSYGNQGFSAYRQSGYFYKKILPEYLSPYCYEVTPGGLVEREDAPLECGNYARPCTAQEVDCQMFTGANTQVPAKTNLQNYCPASCVGFDSFWQEPTVFASGQYQNLIPNLATSCLVQNVGCSEFTALDSLESGGESKEYYSYLRQCVKPSETNANCQVFYIWHNTLSEGLQLHSYTWQAENNQPKLVGDQNTCTATSLWPNNIDYDPDCREVRDQAGNVFYIPYSQTISCSENCRTYRISEQNVADNIFSSADCSIASGHWLANKGACVICQGNGQWDSQSNSCLYRGLPEESQSCPSNQNGCRRYSGSGSANWWSIFTDDFDYNQDEWTGGVTSTETFRAEGYSLAAQTNNIQRKLQPSDLMNGTKYKLQFFAKSNTVNQFTKIAIQQNKQDLAIFDLVNNFAISKDWQIYTFATNEPLTNLVSDDETLFLAPTLTITANGSFFIDEIRLIEPNDEYYLINSTITVPQACNNDYNGQPSAGFMLGCQAYQDQSANTHYLHSFSNLCQESSVGCEIMINTHNITDYQPLKTWDPSEIDEVVYVVYNQNHLCSVNDKGCQRLGRESSYGSQSVYETAFLKLDLDRYDSASLNSIKCSADNVGCQTWSSSNGISYFKDPGNQLCEWREGDKGDGFNWYQRPVSFCSDNGNNKKFCLTNQDCISVSEDSQCLESKDDQLCPMTSEDDHNLKTIGPGGYLIKQPVSSNGYNWTGLCPVTQSGCTEYIDPLFKVGVSLNMERKDNNDLFINIDKFTAYSIQVQSSLAADIEWRVYDDHNYLDFWLFNQDNKLVSTSSPQRLITTGQGEGNYYASFVSKNGGQLQINNLDPQDKVVVKQLSINYNLDQDVNSDGCIDGLVNSDRGCLLFNARKYNQDNYSSLYYDASLTTNDAGGVSPKSSINNNANQLVKVDLSRSCNKWLECTNRGQILLEDGSIQKVCYSFGICDQLDENNKCVSFVEIDSNQNQVISTSDTSSSYSVSDIANLTGYSKVGWDDTGYYNDIYSLSSMSERGGIVSDASINGSFELTSGGLSADSSGYLIYDYKPIGWTSSNNVSVVVSPSQAGSLSSAFKDINKAMAPDGRNFLRIGTASHGEGYSTTNNLIPVTTSTTYILSGDYRTDNNASAGFVVEMYASDNNANADSVTSTLDWVDQWQTKTFEFETNNYSKYIKIKLYVKSVDGYSSGAAYFDNIKLSPALNYRYDQEESSYIAPSCRLYPKGDSLSCDYRLPDNPGIREKGLLGYCLEYDPANTNNCLLWFPVDRVSADLIEEGVGYSGKLPLYYCIDWEPVQRLEYRHAFWMNSDDGVKCPPHYYLEDLRKGCNTSNNSLDSACVPDGNGLIKGEYNNFNEFRNLCNDKFVSSTTIATCLDCGEETAASDTKNSNVLSWSDGWYKYDENAPSTSTNNQVATTHRLEVFNDADGSIKKVGRGPILRLSSFSASSLEFLCQASGNTYNESIFKCLDIQGKEALLTSEVYRDEFNVNVTNKEKQVPFPIYYCSKFIKVVDDTGNNMFYSGRVNIDSNYEADCWIIKDGQPTSTKCIFTDSSMPYASIAYPASQGTWPNKWDSLPDVPGNQPLFFGYNNAGSVHAGHKYDLDQLKTLFAKSYGTYQWVTSTSSFVSQGSYQIIEKPNNNNKISPPSNECSPTSSDYCYTKPTISNIKVNDTPVRNNYIDVVGKNVSLSFNVKVAASQKPLRKILINWGDNTRTSVSGNLLDRRNENQPHIFDHVYTDDDPNYKVRITVTDNWETESLGAFIITK